VARVFGGLQLGGALPEEQQLDVLGIRGHPQSREVTWSLSGRLPQVTALYEAGFGKGAGFATSTLLSKTLTSLVCVWEVGDKAVLWRNRNLCEEGCVTRGRKAKTKTRGPQPVWSWWRWHDRVLTISGRTTLDAALEHSYAAFVRGEAYTDSIRLPDDTRLHHADRDGLSAEDQRDTLSEAWD
jgi:hypothetical protein